MRLKPLIALALCLAAPACAKKDAPSCAIPADLPKAMLEGPSSDQPRRLIPITGYTLSVSWSPQYCASRMTSPKDRFQCDGEAGAFGFVLHGLWPEGKGDQSPQYCKPTRLVPDKVMRGALCSSPSPQLIQHEWEKHGTCMSRDAAAYFGKSQSLYRALKYPDMVTLRGKTVTAQAFQQAFAAANPGLKADEMRLNISKDGWLQEVGLCLDTRFKGRACPVDSHGARPDMLIKIR